MYKNIEKKALKFTEFINSNSTQYISRSGDLLIMQYLSSGMQAYSKGIKDIPTHCGLILIINNLTYVLEATRLEIEPLNDLFENYRDGTRLVLLSDVLRNLDGYCYVRPIKANLNFNKTILNWSKTLKFEPLVSNTMGITEIITLGLGPGYSFLQSLGGYACRLNEKRSTVFCSEFISLFLQRCGHLPLNFKDHWKISPIHLTSKMATLDKLTLESNFPLEWGQEIELKNLMK